MDGSIALVPATLMPKLEASDISTTSNCDTLPSSFGLALHSAGSPLTSSSISSSSMSELFASPGLTSNEPDLSSNLSENDTGDATSMASTSNLENTRTTSNVPSPIIEEDLKTTFFNELDHVLDGITVDLNMDVKPCSDARHVLDTCCRPDSNSDDMFMSHLDELLQSSEPHEFVAESSLSCFDDLFSSFSDTQQDFLLPDGAFLHKLEPLPRSEQVEQAAEQGHGGDEENATQMFTHWLRSNAHWISMSDLRKIKLKTSTIENATKRLGGGKKGMTLFLKFVLVWLQNSQSKAALGRRAAAVSSPVVQSGINMGLGCVTTSSVNLQGHPSFLQSDACLMQGAGAPLHGHNGTYSSSVPCGPDRTSTQSRWTSSLVPLEHSLNVPVSNTGTPSPLTNTTFCTEGPWLSQSSMIHGLSSPMLTLAMCSPVGGTSGRPPVSGCYNIASMTMMTQQKQGFDPTPAATTRAARKSRMERQRWSVRRTRKWSGHTIHRTNQPLLVSGVNHGGPPTKLDPWSQVGGSATQSLSNFSGSARANSYQQRFPSRLLPDPQEARKNERCLRLLFDKELKQSDVGNLGRIVLPKAAETFLPPLESRDGVNLVVEDMNSFKVWNMRYRFWPNNKSRMYLLENTGDFVKSYDLKEGDYMMVYCTNSRNRYVIKGEKGPAQVGASSADNLGHGGGIKKRCTSKKEADVIMLDGANSDESCDDFLLVELIEQSLEASESDMLDAARTHF